MFKQSHISLYLYKFKNMVLYIVLHIIGAIIACAIATVSYQVRPHNVPIGLVFFFWELFFIYYFIKMWFIIIKTHLKNLNK
jgi:hypothetical protein